MTSKELRKNFLDFFEKRGHKIVPSSSLLPADTSVLFTSAGMQQFKEYFLGKESPYGKKAVSCQKCFRTSDIEDVGDTGHLTFLEMLGNFSFGDYFKREAMEFSLEFLVKNLGLPLQKMRFTYFKGDKEVPEDKESKTLWQELGVPQGKIFGFGRKDNFWGPTGEEGPCGPNTEIHFDLTGVPCKNGKRCVPGCKCGRFLELWNLVFNEYYQSKNKSLTLLEQKGVDTGMGLERLCLISQGKLSVFETDLFVPVIREIEKISSEPYSINPKPYRIIVDHLRSVVFLASEGIRPSNVEQGYVLRRILRRVIRFGRLLALPQGFTTLLAKKIIEVYCEPFPEIKSQEKNILAVIQDEDERFSQTLERGIKQFEKMISSGDIGGKEAFYLFESYGFPFELTQELSKEKGLQVDKKSFEEALEKHRTTSRAGAPKKFGGVGEGAGIESAKLHTATHLLQSALREVLGAHVKQVGSDVTPQRLRFDFSHFQKVTEEEVEKVEEIINRKIKEDIPVKKEELSYEEALKSGALAFFKEKYPKRVTVYSINGFSKEVCGGPHAERTSELGHFKIVKEESAGSGIRRIRAILE